MFNPFIVTIMNKEQVLAISGLTAAQKEAAERWFKVPFNKGKEIEGTATQVKQFLNRKIAAHDKLQAAKAKKAEKFGTLNEVVDLVKTLCKGNYYNKPMFSYKDILSIINEATEEKRAAINEIRELEKQIAEKKKALGI